MKPQVATRISWPGGLLLPAGWSLCGALCLLFAFIMVTEDYRDFGRASSQVLIPVGLAALAFLVATSHYRSWRRFPLIGIPSALFASYAGAHDPHNAFTSPEQGINPFVIPSFLVVLGVSTLVSAATARTHSRFSPAPTQG